MKTKGIYHQKIIDITRNSNKIQSEKHTESNKNTKTDSETYKKKINHTGTVGERKKKHIKIRSQTH